MTPPDPACAVPNLPRETFLTIVQHTPLVSIDLICRNPAGEVLLGWRHNRPARGSWFVPGGRIRKDERVAEALQRILQAELGLRCGPLQAVTFQRAWEHLYDDNFAEAPGFGTHYVVLSYELLLDAQQARAVLPDAQHGELRWFTVERLLADAAVHPNSKAYFDPRQGSSGIP